MVRKFKTEILSSAITGKISSDNVYGLYELHRFVFGDETISKSSQIDKNWDKLKKHLLTLYPQLGDSSYDPQVDISFETWNKSQEITIGKELPICPIGQSLATQLHDIRGYYNMGNDCNFDQTNMWEGQLILYGDGWFEGIVIDHASPCQKDRFIFGFYFPDRSIELLKVAPTEVRSPLLFRAGINGIKNYEGPFALITYIGEQHLGVSRIGVYRRTLEDTQELQIKIKAWKKSIIDDEKNILRAHTVQLKKQFWKMIEVESAGPQYTKKIVEREPWEENPDEDLPF